MLKLYIVLAGQQGEKIDDGKLDLGTCVKVATSRRWNYISKVCLRHSTLVLVFAN